jgi:hypothetical protein
MQWTLSAAAFTLVEGRSIGNRDSDFSSGVTSGELVKKDQKVQKKSLRTSIETIRNLSDSQLAEVAGGGTQSNNGCGSSLSNLPTLCLACQF